MSLPPPLGVPDVDYLATSVRPTFGSLPSAVQDAVGDAAGSPVVAADPPVASGFGGAFAGLLTLADGRRVFAKATPPSMPHIVGALRREAEVLPRVAALRCATRLVGAGEVLVGGSDDDGAGTWRVLVLEAVDGVQPGRPWTDAEADAAHDVCVEIATADTRGLVLERLDELLVPDPGPFDTLVALADGSRPWPSGHVRVGAHEAELRGLADGLGAVRGDALVHGDLRPDNLLREAPGAMRALDWNQVCLGAPWVDLVLLWPLMHHHGVDLGRFDGSLLLAGVSADEVDALLAWFVGFLLVNVDAPPPPGCTSALRAHSLFTSDLTVRLLADRRGWEHAL